MIKSPHQRPKNRRRGAADAYVDGRIALGHTAFSLTDFVKESGLSVIAAKRQLARLAGKVVRVTPRQAFFLIVNPEQRTLGAPPAITWLHDYFGWLGRPYYLALQSAAGSFGSNPQALQVTQVMTDRPCRPIRVGRIQVKFFVKRRIGQTLLQQLPQAAAPLWISTPEATVFDLIRYSSRLGGIERVAETITPLLPLSRPRELKRVLESEDESACTQRLGFVVEASGAKTLAKIIYDWLPSKLVPVPLSPLKGPRAQVPVVPRWQVLNNSGELK